MDSPLPPGEGSPAGFAWLRAVLDALPEPVYVKDAAGRFVMANPAFARLAGARHPDELRGRTARDFFPEPDARAQDAADLEVIRSGRESREQEPSLAPRDASGAGAVRLLSRKIPLRGDDGNVRGMISLARATVGGDALDRDPETPAARIGADLARLEKSHEELKAAQGEMIQAGKSEALSRLAAGIAHEVKNPLSQILLGMDVLSGMIEGGGPAAKVMDLVRGAVARIDRIILEMIEFSTPKELGLAACDLNALVERSLALAQGDIAERRVTVEKHLAPGLPPVLADGPRLEQAFLHLLTNGIRSMNHGGTLTVTTRARDFTSSERDSGEKLGWFHAGDRALEVEIRDTGHGIPEEKMGKIFDPFFTTREPGQGMGLGLTVVRKILDLHQARLVIRNRPEGGVTASVTLIAAATT